MKETTGPNTERGDGGDCLKRLVSYLEDRVEQLTKEHDLAPERAKVFKAVVAGQALEAAGTLTAIKHLFSS